MACVWLLVYEWCADRDGGNKGGSFRDFVCSSTIVICDCFACHCSCILMVFKWSRVIFVFYFFVFLLFVHWNSLIFWYIWSYMLFISILMFCVCVFYGNILWRYCVPEVCFSVVCNVIEVLFAIKDHTNKGSVFIWEFSDYMMLYTNTVSYWVEMKEIQNKRRNYFILTLIGWIKWDFKHVKYKVICIR